MNRDLFDDATLDLAPGALLLRGFALDTVDELLSGIAAIQAHAPLRQMHTPGGLRMNVAMSNCGPLGWVSDAAGYRYQPTDPLSGMPWPALPAAFAGLATRAAAAAGFKDFCPDACLVNRYEPGTALSLHQDKNERDFSQPIVSVSLGLSAVFLFGGLTRSERPLRVALHHGDVVVWGGPARLRFHAVAALADGLHPLLGRQRMNLTMRRAG